MAVGRLIIVPPSASRPFLKENLTLTPDNRTLFNALVSSLALRGDVAPEGILKSKSLRWYVDDTTKFIYVKFEDEIDGDSSRGWSLVSTEAGEADKNVSVNNNYQILFGNENINCNGTFVVTLIASSDAEGQEITVKNSGTGTITIDADVSIEGSDSLTSTQSSTWFFSDGEWRSK